MAAFLLRRLGFMILTLFLLSLIIFFAGQILPGDPGRAVLGPFAANSAVQALDHSARRGPAAGDQVPELARRAAARGFRYLVCVPERGRAVRPGRADQFDQAGRARVRHRGAARHHRRRDRRALRGPRGGPGHLRDRALPVQRARVRIRHRADRGVRRDAEGAAGDRLGRGGRGGLEPVPAPDPARYTARLGAIRLHCPYGQGGDHRGAELGLRTDRGAQGAAARRP